MRKKIIKSLILTFSTMVTFAYNQNPNDSCLFNFLGSVNENDRSAVNKKQNWKKGGDIAQYVDINYNVLNQDKLSICLPDSHNVEFRVLSRSRDYNGAESMHLGALYKDGSSGDICISKNRVSGIFRDGPRREVWTIISINKRKIVLINSNGIVSNEIP